MQLEGKASGELGNEYYANEDIAAGSTVTKTTKIEAAAGYHLPITCHFVYENKEYKIDATYE